MRDEDGHDVVAEALLMRFEATLDGEDCAAGARVLMQLRDRMGVDHCEVRYAEARLARLEQGPDSARCCSSKPS